MNWLDSSSFSGLLSQAQKSIDKVLDIPREDDNTSKKTNQNLDAGNCPLINNTDTVIDIYV